MNIIIENNLTNESITNDLISLFKENIQNKNCSEICASSKIKDDLGLDSLDVVELIMKLEEKYNIQIEDEKANQIKTIEDVSKLILELASKQ